MVNARAFRRCAVDGVHLRTDELRVIQVGVREFGFGSQNRLGHPEDSSDALDHQSAILPRFLPTREHSRVQNGDA